MRLIDVDALREEYALAERCEDCPRYGKRDCVSSCYSARDFCAWLNDAPIVSGWVSVNDRMPEEAVPVLVWESQGFAYVDIYKDGVWVIGTQNLSKLTHWMHIPDPPKEVSE